MNENKTLAISRNDRKVTKDCSTGKCEVEEKITSIEGFRQCIFSTANFN
jgi:hypothetical protein